MLVKLELVLHPWVEDVQGNRVCRKINSQLEIPVESVRVINCFIISGITAHEQQEIMDRHVLFDPVLHQASYTPAARDFDWLIEVGYRPGVTDNEGRTATNTLHLVLGPESRNMAAYTSRQYLIKGDITREQAHQIASGLLANELIERFRIKSSREWRSHPGFPLEEPRVTGQASHEVQTVSLENLSDQELIDLSREKVLALSLEEMQTIRAYYQRNTVLAERLELGLALQPTDVELECLAQTWSEHCKHKIFNARIRYSNLDSGRILVVDSLFNTYIAQSTADIRRWKKEGDFCRSVFRDNAGVIGFDQDLDVCIKVETHNSPSALDPYGGALTGIVGVNRDPMGTGMGANLICNTDVFCFASPYYSRKLPPRLLHPRRVMEGVREGVEHGGNKSGIPTVNGAVVFEERYLGKPLVFCGTVGTLPVRLHGRPGYVKKARPGDLIVMTGGRIGKDGIHGATFSSEELHEGSPATAVQIGDPITQRKMYDFIIRARDLGLYNAITDNGAGGLSSSVGEMAEDSGGCDLDLSLAPLKYDGLKPWEILLSEAQERMTLAVPEDKKEEFLALAREMDVEATVLGVFTDSGRFLVRYGQKIVACLDMDFLHHGLSKMELEAEWKKPVMPDIHLEDAGCLNEEFLQRMLSRLNICSREYLIRQYDHEVQGGSVIKPLVGIKEDGPADAAVIRPDLDKNKGLVISNGICPRYSDWDAYWMMANAIDEAVRNNVAVGGDIRHMAGVDNFCWCDPVVSEKNPDGKYKLAQLVRANEALAHFCRAYGVPCISGKDSMKNDYVHGSTRISIPPTVLFSVISVVQDINKCVSSDFKMPEEDIYILGLTREEMGGSEFCAELGLRGGQVPEVDPVAARTRYLSLRQALDRGLISACHDLSDGGLGVALAEMAIGGRIGADVDLFQVPVQGVPEPAAVLYSESASRFLVTLRPGCRERFEALFHGQLLARIGRTTALPELCVRQGGNRLFQARVEDLAQAWKKTLNW